MKTKGKEVQSRELAPAPNVQAMPSSLIEPVASDEQLISAYKRYVSLKDKLLEETDYVWFAVYRIADKSDRKGFSRRDEAEKFISEIRKKGAQGDLEKKIKKSGCLKLAKAFGISTEVLVERKDRAAGFAEFTVRAEAPNGQRQDRTGSCDRTERGKREVPFDTIEATALTRAADRAIMALLGGENTAEEFEESHVETPLPAAEAKVKEEVKKEEAKEEKAVAPPAKTTAEMREEMNAKFAGVKPAKAGDEILKRVWKFARELGKIRGWTKDQVEERMRGTVQEYYGVPSTKDLTATQAAELAKKLEESAKQEGTKIGKE